MIYASSSVKDCTTEQVDVVIGENKRPQVSGHDNGEAAAEQHLLVEEGDGRPGGEGGHLHHQIQVGFLMDTKLCEKTNIMSANNCGQVCSLILIEEVMDSKMMKVTIRRSEVLLI